MVKLQVIYNRWNETQKRYYQDILQVLLLNEIQTDQILLQKDTRHLSSTLNIPRQRLRAFIKQIQLESLELEKVHHAIKSDTTPPELKYLSTGFESLDKLLTKGFQFSQIVEIYGESDSDKMSFISRVLTTFINDFSKDNIFIFDTSGILEPRRLNATSTSDLTDIECFQSFNLKNLLHSMENVAALLSSAPSEHPPLIVIDDPAKLIGFDWTAPEVSQLIKFIQVLSKDMHACVILLQQSIASTTKKVHECWASMVDLRLYLSATISNSGDTLNVIQVQNIRDKKTVQKCMINLFQ